MKKIFLVLSSLIAFFFADSQGILNRVNAKVNQQKGSPLVNDITKVITESQASSKLTNEDIINGLKEALYVSSKNSINKLGVLDGFLGNEAIKIVMPDETQKLVSTLRKIGMGDKVDKAILSMNRAAEDAAAGVGDIFIGAIKQMTIADGLSILKGSDTAATNYLRNSTQKDLTDKIRPIIQNALKKVDATKYWTDVFTNYNKYLHQNVNTDLTAYVIERTLNGLFYSLAEEEKKIRKDPAAQVTEILKKVFGNKS